MTKGTKTMISRALADGVLVVHLAFILFAIFGGLAVLRWRWLAWVHLPLVAWAIFIELTGGICPLTPLENRFRQAAGQAGYDGGFIDHYFTRAIYPMGLTRPIEMALGGAVFFWNAVVYGILLWSVARRQ